MLCLRSALEELADGRECRRLVLGVDVDLRGEAGGGGHDRLDRGEKVELRVAGAEGDLEGLAAQRLVEGLALEHDHLRAGLVEAVHEGRHVHLLAGGHDAHDAVAEVDLGVHDLLVVRQDLLVLPHPAGDLRVGGGVGREVARQVHAPRVVRDVGLHGLVHHGGERPAEVHAVGRVGVAQELERVLVDLLAGGVERAAQDLARRLGAVGVGLRLRLDHQVLERAHDLEPVGPVVLVDDRDELVVAVAERRDEAAGHLHVAVVHREVHEHDATPRPGRHGELVHREGLAEHHLDHGVAVEARHGGGRAHPVDRADRDDEVGEGERGDDGLVHDDLNAALLGLQRSPLRYRSENRSRLARSFSIHQRTIP